MDQGCGGQWGKTGTIWIGNIVACGWDHGLVLTTMMSSSVECIEVKRIAGEGYRHANVTVARSERKLTENAN